MPYSTRRVSLNLQSLGVQLPQSRGSNRSPPNPSPSTATGPRISEHPAKRLKRSHTLENSKPATISLPNRPRPRKSTTSVSEQPAALAHITPPPSPGSSEAGKRVDTEDIKDEIVVAVIKQLEATANKPHQIKDLANILAGVLEIVATSQNPVAIISSRLTNYLKRPWTALAPCPLAKEQVTIHPRRVYYFLTTLPRQEIPEYSTHPPSARHVISPSISGTDSEHSSEMYERDRETFSEESELEFANEDNTLGAQGISEIHFPEGDMDFDESMQDHNEPPQASMHSQHPPLEYDEREFSQTAGAMRQRKESEQAESESRRTSRPPSSGPDEHNDERTQPFPQIVEEPESMDEDQQEHSYMSGLHSSQDVSMLFGHQQHNAYDFHNSPMMRPQQAVAGASVGTTPKKHLQAHFTPPTDPIFAWSDLKSPEHMELAELDDLLGGC